MNEITMKTTVDRLLLMALQEDIPTEDVSTNAVLPEKTPGTVDLICKQDGVIAGLAVFARVFTLLDADSRATFFSRTATASTKASCLPRSAAICACCSQANAWR